MKIDFVVTWLDSDDPEWKKEYIKYKYAGLKGDDSEVRFRDWDLFHYWFRAVECYAPWVNKVFLITNGKFPEWINDKCEKLVLVKHSDYIPKEFLPTFNSCTIELHMNKIPGLSEHFVYFNDDFFLTAPVKPEDYFREGLPCDDNHETVFNIPIYSPEDKFGIYMSMLANIGVINRHFNRWRTVRQSMKRWFGPHLGLEGILLSFNLKRQRKFIGFSWRHYEQPFLKSIFDEAWEKEPEMLNKSCTRFREEVILNQYFFRYWQFASNKFYPVKMGPNRYLRLREHNIDRINKIVTEKSMPSICFNDTPFCDHEEFERTKKRIKNIFEHQFPEKSMFEK